MIIVSQDPLSETASSLRMYIKKGRASIKNPEGTSITFPNGFSHATVRDLSKHHPRNFDKLCGRVGVGLDSFTVRSEQMTGFACPPLPHRPPWTPPNAPACCRPRWPLPIVITAPVTMELTFTLLNVITQ